MQQHFACWQSHDILVSVANQALDVLSGLLSDPNPAIVKTVIQCFGSVYPLLFRYLYVETLLIDECAK